MFGKEAISDSDDTNAEDIVEAIAPFTKSINNLEIVQAHNKLQRLDTIEITRQPDQVVDKELLKYIKKVRGDNNCAKNLIAYYGKTTGKKVANAGLAFSSVSNSVAGQLVTGASVVAAVGGAAISTGGVAIIVGGAIMTISAAVKTAVSLSKTQRHIKELERIMNCHIMFQLPSNKIKLNAKKCNCHRADSHYYSRANKTQCEFIVSKVLPYIIAQKKKKRIHKATGLVPVVGGLADRLRGITRNLYKRYKGTQGKDRREMAQYLTRQHLTTHCDVTDQIISQLLSDDESLGMRSLLQLKSHADNVQIVSDIIFRKLECN